MIFRNGTQAGLTTSGGLGPRSGTALALGLLETEPGQTRDEVLAERYEIEVAGERYAATALARPPYDPDGLRLRG